MTEFIKFGFKLIGSVIMLYALIVLFGIGLSILRDIR